MTPLCMFDDFPLDFPGGRLNRGKLACCRKGVDGCFTGYS